MNEQFELPVVYEGEQLHFAAQLLQEGYLHKFRVDVYGEAIYFEPDEEGMYRAIAETTAPDQSKWNVSLLQEIAEALASL